MKIMFHALIIFHINIFGLLKQLQGVVEIRSLTKKKKYQVKISANKK